MAKTIGSLFVEYRATADKFLADLKTMAKDAKEFEKAIQPLRAQALTIGTAMTVVGGAVTAAFVGMAKQAANYGDAIRDASIRTGVSTQALSGLRLAAEQSGTSFEAVTGSLNRMSRAALAGNKGFAAIGVAVKDSSGHLRPMEAILGDVSDKFATMKDGTEKAALAQQLFGRQGAVMIEFLNQGSAGLKAYNELTKEFGTEVTPEAAAAADAFNDSLNLLGQAQLGLSNTIGQILLPGLTKLVELATGAVVAFRKFAAAHPELIANVAKLAAMILGSGGLLVGLAGVLAILPKLGLAFKFLLGPVGLAVLAVEAFLAAVILFPKFRSFVVDVLHDMTQTFAFFGSIVTSVGKALAALAMGKPLGAVKELSGSLDRAFTAAADAGNTFDGALQGVRDALSFTMPALTDTSKLLNNFEFDLDSLGGKASTVKDEIASLTKSFISTIRPADELGEKLKILLARFDERDVIRAYMDDIISTTEAQRQYGGEISETMRALEKQALVMKKANDIIKANRENILGLAKAMQAAKSLAPTMMGPLISDMEMLGIVQKHNQDFKDRAAEDDAQMAAARQRDIEYEISLSKKWERAWSTAVGNISSKFADSVVDNLSSLFGGNAEEVERIQKQITDITQSQERIRLQNAIDTTRITSREHYNAKKALAEFDKQLLRDEDSARAQQLSKLQKELEYQKSLFRKFASSIKDIFLDLGKSILKIMITDVFEKIAKKATGLLTNALGGLFGGGTGPTYGPSLAQLGIGKAASSVGGGAASSIGSTALMANPWVGGAMAAGSIVSTLVTAFAGRGRQQRTEENTRESRDWLELQTNAWNPLFNQMVYFQKGIYERLGAGGFSVPASSTAVGGTSIASQSVINAPFTFSPSVQISIDGTGLTPIQIRDKIVPEITVVLETGVRGYREKWAQLLRDSTSPGTPAPVGI